MILILCCKHAWIPFDTITRMPKTLCKKKKTKTTPEAKYQCKKCKGLADKKKLLCKPEKV